MNCFACKENSANLCADCVRQTIRVHRSQFRGTSAARRSSSSHALSGQADNGQRETRRRNETHARFSRVVSELHSELRQQSEQAETKRQHIKLRRHRLQVRRRHLHEAQCNVPLETHADIMAVPSSERGDRKEQSLAALRDSIARLQHQWDSVIERLAQARHILTAEAINTFHPEIRQVPVPSKTFSSRFVLSKTRLQHNIAGCAVPGASELKSACLPRELAQTNAALRYLAQCLLLVSSYLGIRLPFDISLGVLPTVAGATASPWAAKYAHRLSIHFDPSMKREAPHLESGREPGSYTSFVTAYTMLVYNVAYICHIRGLQVELSNADQIVSRLLALLQSQSEPRLADPTANFSWTGPTPLAFDFNKLLDCILVMATSSRRGIDRLDDQLAVGEGDEGWGVVQISK